MEFEIYQWLVPIIGLFYVIRTLRAVKQKKRSRKGATVWLIFWCIIIILAIVPNEISFQVAEILGFASNINAIIFVALGLLFLFVFYLSSTIEHLEQQITNLVRNSALQLKNQEKEIERQQKQIHELQKNISNLTQEEQVD